MWEDALAFHGGGRISTCRLDSDVYLLRFPNVRRSTDRVHVVLPTMHLSKGIGWRDAHGYEEVPLLTCISPTLATMGSSPACVRALIDIISKFLPYVLAFLMLFLGIHRSRTHPLRSDTYVPLGLQSNNTEASKEQ